MYRHSSPRRAPRALAVALALCIAPAPAVAQKVLTECSVKDVAKILASMGLEVKDSKDEGKQSYVRFELGGYRVALILYNENTDAQLYAGFADWKVTPEKVNEWNRDRRFSRAYRDDDGDAVLETDIDFTGGVTEDNLKAWVRLFRDQLIDYAKFVRSSSSS